MFRHLAWARSAPIFLFASVMLTSCGAPTSGQAAEPVPPEIAEQLDRYAKVFSFEGTLDPEESDRLIGRLCADSYRMSYSTPGDDKTPAAVLDMNYNVVLSLVHMMHEAARGDEPQPADMVPTALSESWVPFAKLKPRLRIPKILKHYAAGETAYITVLHDLHEGDFGVHNYESHLTWVKTQDGWRLQNKIWVDVAAE